MELNDFVLLISTSSGQLNEKSFLDELFNSKGQVIENHELSSPNLQSHPFKLDNKYYRANIKFVTLKDQTDLDSNLIEQTEVLAILFDIEDDFLAKIETIYSSFNDDNLEEKILICKSSNIPEAKSDKILDWCCNNKFELINLSEVKEESDNEDDGSLREDDNLIQENIGLNRFVEILDTHGWSNIELKDDETDSNKSNGNDQKSNVRHDNLSDNFFRELTINDEPDLDEKKSTFEELFSQIRDFKDKADKLSGDDKYNYAEKVAMAFLNSLDEDD